jgi:acyl-CoA reductase-like NAD-dependent aldehyde dehydrogenase
MRLNAPSILARLSQTYRALELTARAFREPSLIHDEHLRIVEAIEHNFADEAERQTRSHEVGARQTIGRLAGEGRFTQGMREETFSPVAPLAVFDTEDEAIERANRSLCAYAMTRDLNRMFRLSERLDAGTLGINDGAPTLSSSPFGGVKQSGWGREPGREGLQAFLETKHISIGNLL